MKIIREPNTVQELVNQAKYLIDGPVAFSLPGLKRRGWIAVPTLDVGRLFRSSYENLVAYGPRWGCTQMFAIPTDPEVDFCADMELSLEEFDTFYSEYGFYDFILMPNCAKFAILPTTADYKLVAGSANTVEQIFGRSIEYIEAEYQNFADSMNLATGSDFVKREQARYLGVLNRYKALYRNA